MKFKKLLSIVLATAVITSSSGITTLAETIANRDNGQIVSVMGSDYERKNLFNDGWKFYPGNVSGANEVNFDDSQWRNLTLPHDWSIELDFNPNSPATHEGGFLDGGIGWYRKSFTLPESMGGKNISIDFEGVYMDSYVYVNGKQVGNHPYGYTPFSFDITDELICDGVTENVISVKVNNQQPSSRWYSGSGIYRDVNLTVTEKTYVDKYGTFVTTPDLQNAYAEGRADVNVKTDIVNSDAIAKEITVKSTIVDAEGNTVVEDITTENVEGNSKKKFNADVVISNPILWGTENPYIYNLITTVIVDNQVVDEYETDFGLRWTEFTTDNGFYLNGEQMKLEGVCMHHDQGALGAVDNEHAIRRQVQLLKDMGVNSIRVTHNPASQHLIDICNEEGILLIDEAFDTWYGGKKSYDYGRFFEQRSIHGDMTWAEFDIKQMVERGKNDPSIIMWSLGNEIWESNQSKGVQTARNLNDWVKEIDPTRPTTMGEDKFRMGSGEGVHEQVADVIDIVGFNYAENNYDKFTEKYPDWVMYGSETSSAVRSRGEYAHPEEIKSQHTHSDKQQSSYDNDHVGWGKTAELAWKMNRDRGYILGEYIWTGFDYIGEPTPYYNSYPAKSSYFGAIDTAGFPKDAFYFYQSQWSDEPMVHLLPHWNWENDDSIKVDGNKILVYAYTNANSVDLYFNNDVNSNELGTLVASEAYDVTNAGYNGAYKETSDGKLHLEFRVPYEKGKLTAIAKDAEGNEIARDEVKTANDATAIDLSADRQVIEADGYDISYITVDIVDENGTMVPTADNLVNFEVSGNGTIVGVDNGNAASVERYKDDKREAFKGKALVIVQSTKNAGSFTLTATSEGLSSDNITVYTVEEEDLDKNKVVGYDVSDIVVPVNGELSLPTTVEALYANGNKEQVAVTWDEIPEGALGKPGVFKLNGIVEESNIPVKISVIVKGVIGVLDTRMLVPVNNIATLPTEVTLVSNDGSMEKVAVTWERQLTAEDTATVGTVEIKGTVSDVNGLVATAIITVSDNTEELNVAKNEGKEYPKAFATYTGGDPIGHINDGVISKNNSPQNRWTNWGKPGGNYDDYVGIEFDKEYSINKVGISLFSDHGVALPSEIIVEYWNGTQWTSVSNQSKTTGFSVEGTEEITFDGVSTSKIRALLKEDTTANKAVGLTEFIVYSDVTVMTGTALLSDIKVSETTVEGFSETKKDYEVKVPFNSEVPTVTATAKDTASVFVVPALHSNGNTRIIVIAEDGQLSNNYLINFRENDPILETAAISLLQEEVIEDDVVYIDVQALLEDGSDVPYDELQITYNLTCEDGAEAKVEGNKLYAYTKGTVKLSADVTYKGITVTTEELIVNIGENTTDKTIVAYEKVKVETDKGIAPVLPEMVKATFDIGLPREVAVTWDDIDEEKYNKYGIFEVKGTVEGQELKATAEVVVKGISAVENISLATNVRVAPKLPQVLKVYYTDGTNKEANVIWNQYDNELLNTIGSFEVEGTLEGTDIKSIAKVRVSDEVVKGDNIARARNGYDLPMAIASFTNDGPPSNDRVTSLNDDNNDTRWTNWQRTAKLGDWVGVIFGSGIPEKKYINNLEINYFQDPGCTVPESFEIQYYVGEAVVLPNNPAHVDDEANNPFNDENNWVTVTNLNSNPANTIVGNNIYTFDMVETFALRVKMNAKTNLSLAVNEIRAYEEIVVGYDSFDVNMISVNGAELDGFAQDRYNYTMTLAANENLPEVTVDATNNAASSVIYEVDGTEKISVVVRSENGLVEKNYTITLERKVAPGEVDKTALRVAIDYADDIVANGALEGVVPVVVKEFNEALEEAKEIYADENATILEVDNSFNRLLNAIWMLEFKVGDKTELNRVIEIAKALVEEEYTTETWEIFIEALKEAERVSADENAMEEEIAEITIALQGAINQLELVEKPTPVDKTLLQKAIELVSKVLENKDEYSPSTWVIFEDALNNANAVFNNAEATQEEVNSAEEELIRAYLSLRLIPDKSKLEDLINNVKELDLSKYTAESVKGLNKALVLAEEAVEDKDITEAQLNKAYRNLELAVASLEEKETDDKDDSNNGSNGGNNGSNGNGSSGNNGKPGTGALPNTGAVVGTTTIIILAGAILIVGAIMLKKKKKEVE